MLVTRYIKNLGSISLFQKRAISFEDVGICSYLQKQLHSQSIFEPNDMQQQVIPQILNTNNNVVISSETGSGKTLAYLLPFLQRFQSNMNYKGVILVPRKDLVNQVSDVVRSIDKNVDINFSVVDWTRSFLNEQYTFKNNLFISTPLPYTDYFMSAYNSMRTNHPLPFPSPQYLVLDEVDLLLSPPYVRPVTDMIRLMKKVEKRRQQTSRLSDELTTCQMVFAGATIPSNGSSTPGSILSHMVPDLYTYKSQSSNHIPETIHIEVCHFDTDHSAEDKLEKCVDILTHQQLYPLVFVNSVESLNGLYEELLRRDIKVGLLHKGLLYNQKQLLMNQLFAHELQCILTTDLYSRGMDTTQLNTIIQYDFSTDISSFIHRCGRVGRFQKEGNVLCMITPQDHKLYDQIQKIGGFHANLEPLFSHKRLLSKKLKKTKS